MNGVRNLSDALWRRLTALLLAVGLLAGTTGMLGWIWTRPVDGFALPFETLSRQPDEQAAAHRQTTGMALPATVANADRWRILIHTVHRGETLWQVCQLYNLELSTLVAVNQIADPNSLYPGQRLIIPPTDGQLYRVQSGDTLWLLSRRYGLSMAELLACNNLHDPNSLRVGQLLVLPGFGEPATAVVASCRPAALPGGGFLWPVTGPITSPFGPRWGTLHTGLDIGAPYGAEIRAAQAGRVKEANWRSGYGRTIILDHGDGVETLYAHCSRLLVTAGQAVAAGEAVGCVGTSGHSTGPHLHFEIRVAGRPYDPLRYLP